MAVKIRLRRMGQIHAPYYRVIVADSRSPRNGRFIEELGIYDPTKEPTVLSSTRLRRRSGLKTAHSPRRPLRDS